MLKYPRFKASLHAEILSPHRVVLFDDQGKAYQLEGRAYPLITPHLLGPRLSLAEMRARLKDVLTPEELYYAIFRLYKKGYIEEALPKLAKPLAAFCHLIKQPLSGIPDILKQSPITPHFIGAIASTEFKKRCSQMGVRSSQEGVLDVVFANNYRHRELGRFNEHNLAHQKPWLLVQPQGPEIWIGPLFIPGKTPCFQCLIRALKNNQRDQAVIEELQTREAPISHTAANLPIAEPIAANLAAGEIFKWIVKGSNEAIEGKILSLNLCSMEMRSHTVLKRETCSDCGDPLPKASSPPFAFEDSVPPSPTPEEIYQKYHHLISPLTGIMKDLVQIPSLSHTIHNFIGATFLADLEFMKKFPTAERLTTLAVGKGKNEARAKASCICEAIERHSGVYQGGEIKKQATYRELGDEAIHPESVALFSERQYLMRDEWNQNCHRFHFIPERFDETKTIDWSPLWSLSKGCWKWMPTSSCYFGYHEEKQREFYRGQSSGCASGNTKIEAALSGFFELVERDAVALWWYSRLSKPLVNLESFQDPYIAQLTEYYTSIGRKIWVLDLTSDLEIPTMAAFSSSVSGKEILFGFGTHLDPEAALTAALLEMNQQHYVGDWRKQKLLTEDQGAWLESATTENQPYVLPDPKAQEKKEADYPSKASSDPKKNLEACLERAHQMNLEVLLLDQTRPHIGMPVMRVVVPGLRHFWNHFGPGRLYDVPVKMGWVKQKIKEEELNPILMFI